MGMKVDGWGTYGLKGVSPQYCIQRRGNLGGGEWVAQRRQKLALLKNSNITKDKVEDMGKKGRLMRGQS